MAILILSNYNDLEVLRKQKNSELELITKFISVCEQSNSSSKEYIINNHKSYIEQKYR